MDRDFYARSALEVARALLGCVLTREGPGEAPVVAGRIVETEAYTGLDDPASHAAARIGRTARNDPLFGPPGTAYVHLNYGIHWCLNAVTGAEGVPSGVLIRALEPLDGLETMRGRRDGRDALTNGPGRLTQALAIGPELQGHPLDRAPLRITPGDPVPDVYAQRSPRIGISRATDRLYRFTDGRSEWLSRK
ncbi:MAG TPA: DNA-3-methyladenine glycosylase [Gemmatimonadota bacterium]|nr:DNA-3-methyladenine glycosylase [Gemmatimonadota bacterium]